MKEYGNFDASSTPNDPTASGANKQPRDSSQQPRDSNKHPASAGPRRKSIRVIFECCNVYSIVPIPPRVLNGELASWRFHCPRCGRATQVPV